MKEKWTRSDSWAAASLVVAVAFGIADHSGAILGALGPAWHIVQPFAVFAVGALVGFAVSNAINHRKIAVLSKRPTQEQMDEAIAAKEAEIAELKRGLEAELSELRGYEGDLANFSLLSPEMKQLLHELEDGMLEVVVNKGEHRRWIASGELIDLGYLCEPDGFYQMYRVVRLTAPARRALLMHRDDWEKAKAADGIPDGSIFASDNELDVPEPTIAQLAAARTVEAFARAQR